MLHVTTFYVARVLANSIKNVDNSHKNSGNIDINDIRRLDMVKRLLIGHQSALLVYRASGSKLMTPPEQIDGTLMPCDCTTRMRNFRHSDNIQRLMDSQALDLIAYSKNAMHKIEGCRTHIMRGPLPDGSFWSLGNEILVASPALTLLQCCQDLSNRTSLAQMCWCQDLIEEFGDLGKLVAAVELCSELCGAYSIMPDQSGGFHRHTPFVSKQYMQVQLSQIQNKQGVRLARKAAAYASPLSASPRETAVFIVITTPWPVGYGIELPSTNELIFPDDLDFDCCETDETIYCADYRWNGKRLRNGKRRRDTVLEYDSDEYHTARAGLTDEQLKRQGERRDSIEASGSHFLRLTTDHTKSFEFFDEKMRQLSTLLRIDLPSRTTDEEDIARRFQELVFDTVRFRTVGSAVAFG